MKKYYAKSLREYKHSSILDERRILAAAKGLKNISDKRALYVVLENKTIDKIKLLSQKKGLSCRALLQNFIRVGIEKLKS